MLQIVLIRPGSTDYDVQQRIQGSLDIPLNDQGLAEVDPDGRPLARPGNRGRLRPGFAARDANGGADRQGAGSQTEENRAAQNLHQGLWEGMLVEDVRHKQPKVYRQWQEQPENVCPPEGEMLADADQRVHAAVVKLLKRNKEGVIGVVLPEPLLSLARRLLTHGELGDLWKATNGHDRFEVIEVNAEVKNEG